MTGVYIIRNLINGEFYIGSAAIDVAMRWDQHRNKLRRGQHHNYRLQAAWRFYGEVSFRFAVVEECPPEKCIEREQWFIDIFDPAYNICRVAGSMLGCKHSPESLAKMRMPRAKYWASPAAQKALSLARLGRKLNPEHRAKIRASLIGNKRRLGSSPSLATRAKLRMAMLGNKHCLGHKHTAASRAKMCGPSPTRFAAGNKIWLGRKHSIITRTKCKAASKLWISQHPPCRSPDGKILFFT